MRPEASLNNDVEKLWELQQVVTQLGEVEKQLTTKPDSFAEVDAEYENANAEMTKLQEQLDAMAKERRRVDGELSDQQELLKKYQGQLMQVKNQQQYAAAWKEIDAARKHVKELEDSSLKSMGDAEGVQKQLDDQKSGFDDLKGRYDDAHAAWQSSLGDLREEKTKLLEKQSQLEAQLPERLKREFWKVARQRHNVAVTRVDGDSCSMCRTRVRPQVAQQLKRGEFVTCDGCHRILYAERPPA